MSLVPITLTHFLVLGAVIFAVGLFGALAKRNTVAILMGIELMLNSVNLTLVAFSRYVKPAAAGAEGAGQLTGQVFALFILAVAAAEAAVALALVLTVYRARRTVNLDEVNLLKW